ncbi:MAG TPA: ArsR family transcriptional regulator [Dehalococcoidia bacterium]|nr:ArsR family transcriptional regulator [Dehalococcoidia bacterium]
MKSTRDQMRDLLAARGEATVGEIAAELGLNAANIRRHLEVMRAEGLVDIRIQRGPVGRPSYAYRLTERAEDLNAHYPRLVNRLVKRLAALPESEPLLARAFEGVAEDVAGAYRPMVTGATVAERVAETSAALKEEGIVDHWRRDADGYHLMNTVCPYRKAAEVSDAPCHADHKVVQTLVGAPVEQVSRIVDGQHVCEYVVRDVDVIELDEIGNKQ